MKLSTIVGILTLLVVIAGIAAALWQSEPARKQQRAAAMERDLFGAPVPRSDPAGPPQAAQPPAQAPDTAADAPAAEEPLRREMHHNPAEQTLAPDVPTPPEPEMPAEPFEAPKITAFA